MTQYGTWVSYSGSARIGLAVVLLAAAGGLTIAGHRLRLPVGPARQGRAAVIFTLLTWILAIATFLICASAYVQQERQLHISQAAPASPVLPVTFLAACATFLIIFITCPHGFGARMASAVIGALAGPMIFELPFDVIVMARTYPAIPPDPAMYRALFFLPLLLIEITTLSFLAWCPMVKLTRVTFFSLASMLVVFAVWGLVGFGYPSAPIPLALNVLSKILAFVAAVSMFLPQRAQASTRDSRTNASTMPTPAPSASVDPPARVLAGSAHQTRGPASNA